MKKFKKPSGMKMVLAAIMLFLFFSLIVIKVEFPIPQFAETSKIQLTPEAKAATKYYHFGQEARANFLPYCYADCTHNCMGGMSPDLNNCKKGCDFYEKYLSNAIWLDY